MRSQIEEFNTENIAIESQNSGLACLNQRLKEDIAGLTNKEAEYFPEIEGQEFLNHMISETPYMILSIKDQQASEALGI